MSKQTFYVTIFNTFIGIGASFLLKDDALIAWFIISLIIATIIFVERSWLNQHLFKNKKKYALTTYIALIIIFFIGLVLVTTPLRKTNAIIDTTTFFLNSIKVGDYKNAYSTLSRTSQENYSLHLFSEDHRNNHIKLQDFTIEEVTFNKFDKNKALTTISSPFSIYGKENLNLELINEDGQWRVVFSRKNISAISQPFRVIPKPKKKDALSYIRSFLKNL